MRRFGLHFASVSERIPPLHGDAGLDLPLDTQCCLHLLFRHLDGFISALRLRLRQGPASTLDFAFRLSASTQERSYGLAVIVVLIGCEVIEKLPGTPPIHEPKQLRCVL